MSEKVVIALIVAISVIIVLSIYRERLKKFILTKDKVVISAGNDKKNPGIDPLPISTLENVEMKEDNTVKLKTTTKMKDIKMGTRNSIVTEKTSADKKNK